MPGEQKGEGQKSRKDYMTTDDRPRRCLRGGENGVKSKLRKLSRARHLTFKLTKRAKLNLDMLTPSLPLSRSLDLPICLARFPAARLWPKDESLEDSANLSRFRSRFPGFPRHTQSLGASRRKVGSRRTRCQRSIPMLSPPKLIRSFPLAHPPGFRSMSSIPMNAIVEDLQSDLPSSLRLPMIWRNPNDRSR